MLMFFFVLTLLPILLMNNPEKKRKVRESIENNKRETQPLAEMNPILVLLHKLAI